MRERTAGRTALAVLVVVAGVFATIGEGSTTSGGNKAPNAKVASDGSTSGGEKSADEGSDKAKPIPVGTDIKVSSGWYLKVNSAELNANDTIAAANEYQTPAAGKQYVMVNVSLTNKSDKPDSFMTNVSLSLLPSTGIAIDSSIVMDVPDELDPTTQLQPGAVYTGNVVFEAKTEEVADSLLLAEPVFTVDKSNAQRFFALQ